MGTTPAQGEGVNLIQLRTRENCHSREKRAGGVRRGRIEDNHCIYPESWGRHSVVDLRYQETVWKSEIADLPGFNSHICHSLARTIKENGVLEPNGVLEKASRRKWSIMTKNATIIKLSFKAITTFWNLEVTIAYDNCCFSILIRAKASLEWVQESLGEFWIMSTYKNF